VDRGRASLHRGADAAGIALRGHARDERLDAADISRRGNRRERFPVEDLLRPRALHVDNRRLTGHRDRFFERADFQIEVHRRDEVPRQLDAFALECREALERRRHRVRAGS
jgi:hypothetical protein